MATKELEIKIHRWEKTNTRLYKPTIVETKFMHLEEHNTVMSVHGHNKRGIVTGESSWVPLSSAVSVLWQLDKLEVLKPSRVLESSWRPVPKVLFLRKSA